MWSYMSLSFLQKRSGVSIWKETPSSEGPETIEVVQASLRVFIYLRAPGTANSKIIGQNQRLKLRCQEKGVQSQWMYPLEWVQLNTRCP